MEVRMKGGRMIKKILLLLLAFYAFGAIYMNNVSLVQAGSVYYYLPYLTTISGAEVYCMVSNFATDDITTTTFTVMARADAQASQTAKSFPAIYNVGKGRTQLLTFKGQYVYVDDGNQAVDLTSETGTAAAYGGTLKFSNSGSNINCKTLLVTCFQGNTTPKRNIVGYVCEDDSTSGPGNTKNVIGY